MSDDLPCVEFAPGGIRTEFSGAAYNGPGARFKQTGVSMSMGPPDQATPQMLRAVSIGMS
jgi:hypothetical protein